MVKNTTYAATLKEIGQLLTLAGASTFKVRAFERAARAIKSTPESLHAMIADGKAADLPNVGKSIAAELLAVSRGETAPALVSLRAEVPPGLLELTALPGLGAKKIKDVHDRLGITDAASLRAALLDGSLASLPGFGKKSETKLITALDRLERMRGLIPYPRGVRLGADVVETIERLESEAWVAGGLARAEEFVREVAVVTTLDAEQLAGEFDAQNTGAGLTARVDGLPVRFVTCSPDESAWTRWAESSDEVHRRELESRTADRSGSSEDHLATRLGLPWIPAPQRVAGTLQAIDEGWWQAPVTTEALRSDLHMHTTWSDGAVSVREMAEAAAARGLEYIAITDHSGSLRIANGLDRDRLLKQIEEIDALNATGDLPIRVLKGLEVDIMSDGTLDMQDDVLAKLDWVVGSVHQSMQMDADKMTTRLLAAVGTGQLSAIGHPTGRKIGKREAYSYDFETVLDACEEQGVALEINASPNRMDLREAHVRAVLERPSLWLTINTDAHSTREFGNARHGVAMAQRAGAPADRVVNCLGLDDFLAEVGMT